MIGFNSFVIPMEAQNPNLYGEMLIKAEKEYELGNLSEAESIIKSLDYEHAEISDQWKTQRLLAMIYITDNRQDEARVAAENMLELNPKYKPNYLKDPTELVKLLNNITIIPKFSLGLAFSIGSNTTFPQVTKTYTIADYDKTYTSKSGFQFGLTTGYALTQTSAIESGLYITQKSYDLSYGLYNWNMEVNENLTYLELPLTFKYSPSQKRRLRLFIQGGAYVGYLLFSNNDFKTSNITNGLTFEIANLNSKDRRNEFNFGIVTGLGLNYKLGEGNLFLQVNYYKSFSNITKETSRYNSNDLLFTYYYIDDDIILNNITFNIGYTFYMNYKIIRKSK